MTETMALVTKEETALNKLYEKREALNGKIKLKEQELDRLRQAANSKIYLETEKVLNEKGLSLSEVIAAVRDGNLDSLQSALSVKLKAK